VFIRSWPFTRQAVIKNLGQVTSGRVAIRKFRQTYFPHPGAVAEGVLVSRGGGASQPPLITIEKLTIQATYTGMLRHHFSLIRAEGLHAIVSLGESLKPATNAALSKTVIDELQADGALLDFMHADPARVTRFQVQQFRIHDLGSSGRMAFQVAFMNPMPPVEVFASGELGPWQSDDPRQTSVSGVYSFRNAELGALAGVAGLLSSAGKFEGPISALQVDGSTDASDFQVSNVAHRERLTTNFRAVVNATNGDVTLPKGPCGTAPRDCAFLQPVLHCARSNRRPARHLRCH